MRGSVTVSFKGLDRFTKKLKENVTLDDVRKIVDTNGNRLVNIMKRQTTSAYVKGYTTGDTAGSITKETRMLGLTVAVGPTMDYDPYVEFGTRYMSAEPIIRPSAEIIQPKFLGDLEKVTDK